MSGLDICAAAVTIHFMLDFLVGIVNASAGLYVLFVCMCVRLGAPSGIGASQSALHVCPTFAIGDACQFCLPLGSCVGLGVLTIA